MALPLPEGGDAISRHALENKRESKNRCSAAPFADSTALENEYAAFLLVYRTNQLPRDIVGGNYSRDAVVKLPNTALHRGVKQNFTDTMIALTYLSELIFRPGQVKCIGEPGTQSDEIRDRSWLGCSRILARWPRPRVSSVKRRESQGRRSDVLWKKS